MVNYFYGIVLYPRDGGKSQARWTFVRCKKVRSKKVRYAPPLETMVKYVEKPPGRLRGGLRRRLLWSRRRIPFASAWPLPSVRAPCRGVVRSSGLRDSGAPLGDAECAVCMPAGGVEWHNIFRHLRICRLPCHSLSPNARSVCHSVASSGTPMRQHSSGVIEEGSSIGLEHEGQGHPAYP